MHIVRATHQYVLNDDSVIDVLRLENGDYRVVDIQEAGPKMVRSLLEDTPADALQLSDGGYKFVPGEGSPIVIELPTIEDNKPVRKTVFDGIIRTITPLPA